MQGGPLLTLVLAQNDVRIHIVLLLPHELSELR